MDFNSPCDQIKVLFRRLPPMKSLSILLLLPLLGMTTKAKGEEKIILNSTQTPNDVGTFSVDDTTNTGGGVGRAERKKCHSQGQPCH